MSKQKRKSRGSSAIAEIDETSQPFIGRWNTLVSTTNWEKGKIIHEWRTALVADGAPAKEYSDEAWSRRVGNVSPQHVGRLRRVFERFSDQWEDYDGLYWSHFHSALEWPDAEMWLEGAVQSKWSISQMRAQRWEAIGAPPDLKPRDEDIISAELDEDVSFGLDDKASDTLTPSLETVRDPGQEESFGPDFGEEGDATDSSRSSPAEVDEASEAARRIKPFAELPELPSDLGDAFESFKLAILNHKMAGWKEVSRDDLIATLDALKELALAP